MERNNTLPPQSVGLNIDDISKLPTSNDMDSSQELQTVFNIKEEIVNNSSFKNEISEIVLLVVLFIGVSMPFVTNMMEGKVPENFTVLAQGLILAFLFYIVKNTYLSKEE